MNAPSYFEIQADDVNRPVLYNLCPGAHRENGGILLPRRRTHIEIRLALKMSDLTSRSASAPPRSRRRIALFAVSRCAAPKRNRLLKVSGEKVAEAQAQ